jgi:hypothetical protein
MAMTLPYIGGQIAESPFQMIRTPPTRGGERQKCLPKQEVHYTLHHQKADRRERPCRRVVKGQSKARRYHRSDQSNGGGRGAHSSVGRPH